MLVGVEGLELEGSNGFMADEMLVGFGESSSSESEWNEETSSSSEEGLALGEDEDFGLPEMVIFFHEPIYQVCKEKLRYEEIAKPSMKCGSFSSLESYQKSTGKPEMYCCGGSVKRLCGDGEEECVSGIVSFDERMNVYKKVILVRDVEEVICCSPSKCTQESDQVGMRKEVSAELLDYEVDRYVAKESFYSDAGSVKGLKNLNCNQSGNVSKLQSLKELMSMTSDTPLSPPPSTYLMQKSDTDCVQPYNNDGRQSFSFPILAKEWFGSPERMAETSNKFPLQGLLRYFRCCSF